MKKITITHSSFQKLRSFFPWVYANEIEIGGDFESGEIVEAYSRRGEFLAIGYINPKCTIAFRALSFQKQNVNRSFFEEKIKKAIFQRKEILKKTNSARLIHSEADDLSGLIVDKFDDALSIQINTAGIDNFRDIIIDILQKELNPSWIIEKSDENSRKIEGLENKNGTIFGKEKNTLEITEDSIKFLADLGESQKTGFYLDQRKNRQIVANYVKKGDRVLDLFCNVGGFGIYALKNMASEAIFVDISQNAIAQTKSNLAANNLKNYELVEANVFDYLKDNRFKGVFDLVVIDPPSFAKTKEQAKGAKRGFKYLMLEGVKALKDDGLLAVFSCSFHVSKKDLLELALEVSVDAKVRLILLEEMKQDNDHPSLINAPASFYLNGLLFRVQR